MRSTLIDAAAVVIGGSMHDGGPSWRVIVFGVVLALVVGIAAYMTEVRKGKK